MTDATKKKIKSAVEEYIRLFPDEFQLFKKELHEFRWGLRDHTFATPGHSDMLLQEAYRIPASLHSALWIQLSTEEWTEWKEDKGTLWFMKAYPIFRIPEKT